MEFRYALIFLFFYFIRPQDWIGAMSGFNIMRPLMVLWIIALAQRRTRPPLPGLLRTPHDWAMLAYFTYIVATSPDPTGTFTGFLPLVVFYFLTVQTLTSWNLIFRYIQFWNWMLAGVALLAVGSLYGLDFTGAGIPTSQNFGRLAIGTWLHNNPNALCHSVVLILPLSYYLYFWRSTASGRTLVFPLLCVLAFQCAYATESKGGYLVGGIMVVLLFVFGRPLPVRILAISSALTMGVSALSFMPRMSQMGNLRDDEGVMGRLMAWEMAKGQLHSTGYGWRQFKAWIEWEGERILKATHSSYVQIGGDLGMYGLFFFALVLWVSLRGLSQASAGLALRETEECCRRCALILVSSYIVSSWMINREYHSEFFLIIAVAAAIHRHHVSERMIVSEKPNASKGVISNPKLTWNRINLPDIAAASLMTWGILSAWDYIMKNL